MITSPATQFVELESPFAFRSGEALAGVKIAYETWGQLNDAGDNALMIFTGMSPTAHVAASEADPAHGWWEGMVGADCPIDTNRWFVVCVNPIGSCFGSTGPTSIDPETGKPFGSNFPTVAVEDIATGCALVLDHLNIEALKVVVGPSMGGMTALAFSAMYPQRAQNALLISCASAATPFAIALRSLQRELIRSDDAWLGGDYALDAQPVKGMRLARKLGMTTYRAPEEWQERFGRRRVELDTKFEVEAYLEARADDFITRYDANSYICLSRALDLFDLATHGDDESVLGALGLINWQQVQVMGATTDILFPLWQQVELAEQLEQAGLMVNMLAVDSNKGHDAFLAGRALFYPQVEKFLRQLS